MSAEIIKRPNLEIYGGGINWLPSTFLNNISLTNETKAYQDIGDGHNFRVDTYNFGSSDYASGEYLVVLVELLENDTTVIDTFTDGGLNYLSLVEIIRFYVSSFNPSSTYRLRYSLVL